MEPTASPQASSGTNVLTPEALLACLTWAAFFAVLFVLQKFAWKPILSALKKREDEIRQSVENADRIKAELAAMEASKAKILEEAKAKANDIIEQSRRTSSELARQIETRAKKNAEDIISSAHQEIEGEREQVRGQLKKESAQIAVALAEKILKENLDTEKTTHLINQAIKEI